jgi:hypothetical protein
MRKAREDTLFKEMLQKHNETNKDLSNRAVRLAV